MNGRTVVQNSYKSRRKYWATRLFVRSHRTAYFAHALIRSLARSLTPDLVGKRFFLNEHIDFIQFSPIVGRFMNQFASVQAPRFLWTHRRHWKLILPVLRLQTAPYFVSTRINAMDSIDFGFIILHGNCGNTWPTSFFLGGWSIGMILL